MTITESELFITVLNKKLRVRQFTQQSGIGKPTLVFLHEGLGSIELWKDFPKLVTEATGLNAMIYERQGYGKSDHLDLPRPLDYLEIEAQEYLPALLQQLNINNPILIGHSDGGTIALIYAALYPTHALITAAAHVLVEDVTIKGIQEVVKQYTPKTLGKRLERYHSEKADELFWAWANTWLNKDFRTWNINALLPNIDCPTLVLQGKDDEYATDKHLDLIVQGIGKKAQGVLLDNCAHSPHIQAKSKTIDTIVSFIKKITTVKQ